MRRIKDCVQSNTPCTSCQRGCTAFPFSPAPPHSLLICQAQKHPLFPPVLHKGPLWFLISLTLIFVGAACPLWSLSSQLPPPVAVQANYFSAQPRGVKVEARQTVDETGWKPVLCSLSFACSAKDREWYLYRPSVSCSPNATCRRGGSAFVCIYVC